MMDLERVNAYMERVKASETQTFEPVSDKLKVGLDLGTAIYCTGRAGRREQPGCL